MAFLTLALAAAVAAAVTVPPQPALTEQIARADATLFELFFVQPCDEPRFRSMLASDLEFYHDRDGYIASSAEDFVSAYRRNCASRADPAAWRSRRELVRSSLHVDPVPGYGAMEVGEHLFHERHGATGTEKLVGRARFAMVWALGADGKWKLRRVLSFAHAPVK